MTDETNLTPTYVTLGEAARRTGLSKATLSRKVRNGEFSVRERGSDGAYRIDPSELLRFMDAARVQRATRLTEVEETVEPAPQTPETPLEIRVALAEARLADLKALADKQLADLKALTDTQIADLRKLLEEVRADRDRWADQASQAQALATRLLPGPRPERRGWRWWRRRAG